MATVAIVYQSNHGHTAAVAEALERGAAEATHTEVHLVGDGERVARIAARWASSVGYQTVRTGEERAREFNAAGREAWTVAAV